MASIFRRKDKDGQVLPRWSYHYRDHTGRLRMAVGTRDKSVTRAIAEKKETEAQMVRAGLKDVKDLIAEQQSRIPLSRHIDDYRCCLLAKGDTHKHACHIAGVVERLLEDAGIQRLAAIAQEPIQAALRRIHEKHSARTANHARGAILAWVRWLYATGRIIDLPRWLGSLRPYNERIDPKRIRRTLTPEELTRLLETTETAPPIRIYGHTKSKLQFTLITGSERAALYRLATATGLRANEIRTLTPDCFQIEGNDPRLIVKAAYSKHRREDVQPIRKTDAEWLRTWLENRKDQMIVVPEKTAKMLRNDLERAGIPYQTTEGVLDFHSLRATYITRLVDSGVDPKRVQVLARHSTITLTLDRYAKTTEQSIRSALEMT